ncbi:head GIN domain-containing protein [Pseudoflavitalea rhizosphaerae]|uniref:head GIN domain-containing protein n=1 Tax=Pseudoflavitalea rhizosphaerae TaxID=1884793 RepID=UPI000F8F3AD5|nr:head GIN domain-containing protein [Pseudoflavitalea rhizosphaerae]
MKRIGLSLAALLFTVVLLGQKTFNDPNAEVRDVKGFKGVNVATGIQLYITQDANEAVAISAESAEARQRVKTIVQDGVLRIFFENTGLKFKFKYLKKQVKAYVSIATVEKLGVSSGAVMQVEGAIKSDKLELDVQSGGTFKGNVEAASLDVENSSGAVVKIAGTAGRIAVDGSSGSDLSGYGLVTEKATVKVSSGASVKLTINKEVTAKASSGGELVYKGSAARSDVNTSSGGSVRNSK